MSALGDCLEALDAVLDNHGLRWFVFGAQAVCVRGAPRATQDVDVTVEVEPNRVRPLRDDLVSCGFVERFPKQAEHLLAVGRVLTLAHSSGMELDIIIAGSGLEDLALERATLETIDGVNVPVASATDLVVMKVLSGRGKDLDDVRAILAGDEVDVGSAQDLLEQLDAALGDTDLAATLSALVAQ